MGKKEKDIVSFSCATFDEKLPEVLAVTPSVNGIPLPQLISEFEGARHYEPAGGYVGIVPKWFDYGPLEKYFLGTTANAITSNNSVRRIFWAVSVGRLDAGRCNVAFKLKATKLSGTNLGNHTETFETIRSLGLSFLMAHSIEMHFPS